MLSGLGRSPVEVQRCPLNARDSRLRSSSAHLYREMVKEGSCRDLAVEVQLARRRGAEEEKEKKKKVWRIILKFIEFHLTGGE